MSEFSSRWLQQTAELLASWPGVGKRTALRYVLYLMRQPPEYLQSLARRIEGLGTEVRSCRRCGNFADEDLCAICAQPRRSQQGLLCVVEDLPDLLALENTGSFSGVYHILGGCINPSEGVGPEQLRIRELEERIPLENPSEIILALSATPEADTTAFYLHRRLASFGIPITTLARGIGFGSELQYTDDLTLARSMLQRVPYQPSGLS
ncbi:MAG: recombination mediator RecR [Flavobacteriales bacterium]|nr:recombination mediator RecR [Flavobacteriales bacterium]MCX7650502.1 recombination mediator RecR [Flavobacteriales bacterium]MDW8432605.1 recombination mediator RecR [Flavobacteriales bacterium]